MWIATDANGGVYLFTDEPTPYPDNTFGTTGRYMPLPDNFPDRPAPGEKRRVTITVDKPKVMTCRELYNTLAPLPGHPLVYARGKPVLAVEQKDDRIELTLG